jgi:thiamine biosynthesis lipoprotein
MKAGSAARTLACLLAVALMGLASCSRDLYRETRPSMSTLLTVIVAGGPPPDWDALFALADTEAARFDYRRKESPLWRLNHEGSARLDPENSAVLHLALEIAGESGGAFDPTLLPVTALWDFETGGRVPGPEELAQARSRTGYRALRLDSAGEASLPEGFALDLGGIAKGAVVDLLAEHLIESGRSDFLIDAGGDILVSGQKDSGQPWVIAVRHPRKSDAVLGLLGLGAEGRQTAVVTSGDYERYFEREGVRYHHILDPATGRPARGLVSVTVIAPSAAEADGLATAAFVLGPEAGLRLLETLPRVEGLLIEEAGDVLSARTTGGFPLSPADLELND